MISIRLKPDCPLWSLHDLVIGPSLTPDLEARPIDAPTYLRCNIPLPILRLSASFESSWMPSKEA